MSLTGFSAIVLEIPHRNNVIMSATMSLLVQTWCFQGFFHRNNVK